MIPDETGHPPRAARWTRFEWLAVGACVALGALRLWTPFTWDQAMFAMGGERVLDGGLLYRDYWDTKQPGIFWFFAAGMRLFGASEAGPHALEVAWFAAFAAALVALARRFFQHRWGAGLAALIVTGFYWAVTEDWHQTQPEGLVAIPMFVSVALALDASRRERGAFPRWLVAGLAAGVIGAFKLLLVAIPAVCWLASLARRARDPRPGAARDLAVGVAGLALGLALPLAATAGALAAQGVWAEAWRAWVVFPREVGERIEGLPLRALRETFTWCLERWTPLLPLAAVGAWTGLRGRNAALVAQLLLWLAACAPIVLVQRFSGWEYHAWLALVPLGLLAALGADALAGPLSALRPPQGPRERRWLLAGALTLLFAQPVALVALQAALLAKDRFATTPALRERHLVRASRGGAYLRFGSEGAFLREAGARPGPIYVIGNPLVYWRSGRRQAVPRTGGILTEFTVAREWREIVAALDSSATPYVFVEPHEAGILDTLGPEGAPMREALATRYREIRRSDYGTWYERVER